MKSSILRMLALPVAAFALASAGALSTSSTSSSSVKPPIIGYVHATSSSSCDSRNVNCSSNPGATCMSADATPLPVWKYNALGTACDQQLFKP
jgi:hypothetical protein